MSKQNFLHTQEKKNKINPRRMAHLIEIIEASFDEEIAEIKIEGTQNGDQRKNNSR